MDKLVERENATRNSRVAAPALAVQFFLVPLAVVAITVLVFVGFRSMVADQRSARSYLDEIRYGGWYRQWPAAYELSQLMADPKVRGDRALAPEMVKAFVEAKDADPRVRRYLALAIGRLDPPLPAEAVTMLTQALADPDSESRISAIWALGSSGDPAVIEKILPLYASSDPGIRKMVVYALGALPGDSQTPTLRAALEDETADVRWNAAVALARHGSRDGVRVLEQMLDRSYVEQTVKRDVNLIAEDEDPIADVMISGLRAAATLKDQSLRPSIEGLSQQDRSLRVRQAALEALKDFSS